MHSPAHRLDRDVEVGGNLGESQISTAGHRWSLRPVGALLGRLGCATIYLRSLKREIARD